MQCNIFKFVLITRHIKDHFENKYKTSLKYFSALSKKKKLETGFIKRT